MSVHVATIRYDAVEALALSTSGIQLIVVPEVGGKVISLRSTVTGREYLWRDPNRKLRPVVYGSNFGGFDISGFDDCFPTVDECRYPEGGFQGLSVPDHGELWCQRWTAHHLQDGLHLVVTGRRFPYRFEKWITLASDPPQVRFDYRVTSAGNSPFTYLWVAHPLLAMEENSRVIVPGHPKAYSTFALGQRIDATFRHSWAWPHAPTSDGRTVDYSLLGACTQAANDKVWLHSPPGGWCALQHPGDPERLVVTFDPRLLPWLGICVNHCGWPDRDPGYWVAIEPGTSRHDALDKAIVRGTAVTLHPRQQHRWHISFTIAPRPPSAGIPDNPSDRLSLD